MIFEEVHIGNHGADLVHEPNPLPKRLAALHQLRDIATTEPFTYDTVRSIKSISAGLYCESTLVRQKCIYALGQSRYSTVVPILQEQLADQENEVGCRLEAAKGLALLRDPGQEVQSTLELLKVRYNDQEEDVLRDAAEVAAARIGWELKAEEVNVKDDWFGAMDIAPPFDYMPEDDEVEYFSDILLDESESLFSRCRAMTSLRNLCLDDESAWTDYETISRVVYELTRAHYSESEFIRYQLILILGQISHEGSMPYLVHQLQNNYSETSMVRAAAAEMLGDFIDEKDVVDFMQDFEHDKSEIVRECVSLALAKIDVLH